MPKLRRERGRVVVGNGVTPNYRPNRWHPGMLPAWEGEPFQGLMPGDTVSFRSPYSTSPRRGRVQIVNRDSVVVVASGDKRGTMPVVVNEQNFLRVVRRHQPNPPLVVIGNPPPRLTVKQAMEEIRHMGLEVTRTSHGEFRVNLPRAAGGNEATAYYTNDAKDAVVTARWMAKTAGMPPVVSKSFQREMDSLFENPPAVASVASGAKVRGELMSKNVHQLKYTHAADGQDYVHDFERGVHMLALPNGAVLLYHPSKPVWEDR